MSADASLLTRAGYRAIEQRAAMAEALLRDLLEAGPADLPAIRAKVKAHLQEQQS